MILTEFKPRKALNKAFLKVKPNRLDIERFKSNLIQLSDRTNDTESEEFHKNLVSDFLKKTYYEPNHFINTKGRNDLVIHNGDKASSSVGVIIEAKKPTNKSEMISVGNINKKAFQELVLYYLRERISHKNVEVKYLVVTNINEWFVFDATTFDRLFAQNHNFVRQFNDFEEGRLADTKTDFFYRQIAEPFIAKLTAEIEFTYFNLQDYQKPLRNDDSSDDNKLIELFKLLSPEHLLKKPFANDSNSLDKRFYSELLHIIGLTEIKDGGKKLIQRNKEGERLSGSILEDAIIQIDGMDKLSRLDKPYQYGSSTQERLFNVALELSITWINRILFLKLLEAQIVSYHRGDKSFAFLHLNKIKNYDDLNTLFFQVLARKHEERNEDVKKAYERVPYLNSSLFEPTEIEHATLFISNLKDEKTIPIISTTVLKNEQGKKRSGSMSTLQYLFEFLDSYDFGAEGDDEIQEDNKPLINASVLGLIFEKINGYKDGSFFTPGFITMYMSRETIRKAVVQKFNETKQWNCQNFDDLYDKIEDRGEANQIVNSIKICDPAVGSGHFLVSALNEIIAVKNDLKILQDREGKRLKEYLVEVINDELTVTDDEGDLFQYNPKSKESQRIQETLFHEKQTIIENCLFGVDINPNSVKICRLRLWIELLKNAYYTKASLDKGQPALETLPNIDINIKCGNSLVSRFAIDADIKQALKNKKLNILTYRNAVASYKNATNKESKRELIELIATVKENFIREIRRENPLVQKLNRYKYDLNVLQGPNIFEEAGEEYGAKGSKKKEKEQISQLKSTIDKIEEELDAEKNNKIFDNAFEWRFEFPEVLNDAGDFIGFDVVIGNPPYGVKLSSEVKSYTSNSIIKSNETAILFISRGRQIVKQKGLLSYIIPKAFTYSSNYQIIRDVVKHELEIVVDCNKPWTEVKLEACIFQLEMNANHPHYFSYKTKNQKFLFLSKTPKKLIDEFGFILNGIDDHDLRLAQKIRSLSCTFGEISTNKRGIGYQRHIAKTGRFKIIGGIDLERGSIKDSFRGFLPNRIPLDDIGLIKENAVLVQNIVAHIANPTDHIKIIATLPPHNYQELIILDTINQIVFNDEVENSFACALLNSKLLNWYAYNFIYGRAIRTMHFDNVVTNRLPFPKKYFANKQKIDDQSDSFINQEIYKLYGLTKEEIKIVEGTTE